MNLEKKYFVKFPSYAKYDAKKTMSEFGFSIYYFGFLRQHQFGPPRIFLLTDNHHGLFRCCTLATVTWSLISLLLALSSTLWLAHPPSPLKQKCVYTEAKNVPPVRPNILGHMDFLSF
jgi:hypothetical protein